jgi:glutamyl-tRNA synthetase
MSNSHIRVRFAPSPTGYLHVGGARTALYSWLYARHNKGKFVLRIEDTDRERSTKESIEAILESLAWMGIDWDEGPFFQSERLAIYAEYAQKLIADGRAERCDADTAAVVFKFPEQGQTVVDDLVHGKIEFDNKDIKDQIIIKSDGYPTYNFACVIDDALMQITHVIRGDDHISNTPKQIALYKALGFKVPKYAHIPLIMGKDNTRLSKRHGAVSVLQYKEKGYLSEAFVNYLALLGWSAGDNQEVMDKAKLVDKFSVKRVTGKSAIFDNDKLDWLNGQYIKQTDTTKLVEKIIPVLQDKNLLSCDYDKKWLISVFGLFKSRLRFLTQFVEEAEYFFMDELCYDTQLWQQFFQAADVFGILSDYREVLVALDSFESKSLEAVSRDFLQGNGVKGKVFFPLLRFVLTGRDSSPAIFDVMCLLGKDKVMKRLECCLKSGLKQ